MLLLSVSFDGAAGLEQDETKAVECWRQVHLALGKRVDASSPDSLHCAVEPVGKPQKAVHQAPSTTWRWRLSADLAG